MVDGGDSGSSCWNVSSGEWNIDESGWYMVELHGGDWWQGITFTIQYTLLLKLIAS